MARKTRLRKGTWNCVFCDTNNICGSERVCPCCGKTRGQDANFKLDVTKNNYVDAETAKTINRNPDWLCSYCDSLNSDSLSECYNCGATKDASTKNYFEHRAEVEKRRADKERRIEELTRPQQKDTPTNASCTYEQRAQKDTYTSTKPVPPAKHNEQRAESTSSTNRGYNTYKQSKNIPWAGVFQCGAIALAAILVIMLLVTLFTPKVMDIEVSDLTWERSIGVETLTAVDDSGWSLPNNARLHYTREEIKDYEKVLDHYETKSRTYEERILDHYEEYVVGYNDLGNGYFEEIIDERPVYRYEERTETWEEPVYRDEPIYATKYYYEIDKWLHSYNSESRGHKSDGMYWNEPTLKDKQRESGRQETCYISFLDEEGEKITYTIDRNEWDTISVGDSITIKVVLGHATIYVEN